MKTRAEIKAQAMRGFTSRYWPAVGISLLAWVILAVMGWIPGVNWLLNLFVGTIILVGLNLFSLHVYRGNELKVESLFEPFSRYGRVLGGSLWMYLWLFLWSLIFFVPFIVVGFIAFTMAITTISTYMFSGMPGIYGGMPGIYGGMPFLNNYWTDYWNGFAQVFNPLWLLTLLLLIPVIIKALAYFCTRYILADSPNVGAIEALTLSNKMMAGNKGKLFVLGLTFIGWMILCGLTAGILYIFYVGPYMNATFAGFYDEVKQQAKQKGIPGAELL